MNLPQCACANPNSEYKWHERIIQCCPDKKLVASEVIRYCFSGYCWSKQDWFEQTICRMVRKHRSTQYHVSLALYILLYHASTVIINKCQHVCPNVAFPAMVVSLQVSLAFFSWIMQPLFLMFKIWRGILSGKMIIFSKIPRLRQKRKRDLVQVYCYGCPRMTNPYKSGFLEQNKSINL